MAKKEEIIAGLELTITQAERTTSLFAEGEWDQKRAAGWTPREVYAHLASVAAMVPGFAQAMLGASEGQDVLRGLDIDQINAQAVGAMASMTPEQVMQAFQTNYRKLIDFVKSVPDEQLDAKRPYRGPPVPASDILANAIMLHGLHHVYEAADRPRGG